MYYRIGRQLTPAAGPEPGEACVALFSGEQWAEARQRPEFALCQPVRYEGTRSCRLEVHRDYLAGEISLPLWQPDRQRRTFSCYIRAGWLIFVDDTGTVRPMLEKIASSRTWKDPSLERIIYDFLEELIQEDINRLEELEERIYRLENAVLSGTLDNFTHKMMALRKELLRLGGYYRQLVDIGQELQENENGFFQGENLYYFRLFTDRATRLQSSVQAMRDYSMQVWEVYQSQVDIRQNKIMKVLTVVTTLFLPLSLIAGWYGMNFAGMPELHWKYGYPLVILVSLGVVALCIWYFKKKRFL